jgi:hypothetical protein
VDLKVTGGDAARGLARGERGANDDFFASTFELFSSLTSTNAV